MVDVSVAVGCGVAVCVGTGVAVAVGRGVAVKVEVGRAVDVSVAVGWGVSVSVSVGGGDKGAVVTTTLEVNADILADTFAIAVVCRDASSVCVGVKGVGVRVVPPATCLELSREGGVVGRMAPLIACQPRLICAGKSSNSDITTTKTRNEATDQTRARCQSGLDSGSGNDLGNVFLLGTRLPLLFGSTVGALSS